VSPRKGIKEVLTIEDWDVLRECYLRGDYDHFKDDSPEIKEVKLKSTDMKALKFRVKVNMFIESCGRTRESRRMTNDEIGIFIRNQPDVALALRAFPRTWYQGDDVSNWLKDGANEGDYPLISWSGEPYQCDYMPTEMYSYLIDFLEDKNKKESGGSVENAEWVASSRADIIYWYLTLVQLYGLKKTDAYEVIAENIGDVEWTAVRAYITRYFEKVNFQG